MSDKTVFVVVYAIGDEYTFSATEAVPVEHTSKEALLNDFELAMAAYVPDGPTHFQIDEQVFEYRHFIFWKETQKTPRRVSTSYDSEAPDVYTMQEWLAYSRNQSRYFGSSHDVNVVKDDNVSLVGREKPTFG